VINRNEEVSMPGTSFYSAVKTVKRKEYSNHCEMAVKKALEALDGVEKAEVSHVTGTAVYHGQSRSRS
jgi:cation transport ATPase